MDSISIGLLLQFFDLRLFRICRGKFTIVKSTLAPRKFTAVQYKKWRKFWCIVKKGVKPRKFIDFTVRLIIGCSNTPTIYEKTEVAQNRSNLLLINAMYNMSTLQLIQLKRN